MNEIANAQNTIYTALCKAQGEFTVVTKSGHVKFMSKKNGPVDFKYATLDDILAMIRPVLSANGLAVVQVPVRKDRSIGCHTTLYHESGASIDFGEFLMDAPSPDPKEIASILTYSRRYILSSVFSIATMEDKYEEQMDGAITPKRNEIQPKIDTIQPERNEIQPERVALAVIPTRPTEKLLNHPQYYILFDKMQSLGISKDKMEVWSRLPRDKYGACLDYLGAMRRA